MVSPFIKQKPEKRNFLCGKAVAQCQMVIWLSHVFSHVSCIKWHFKSCKSKDQKNMSGQNKHKHKCVLLFWSKEIIKILMGTKDAVYLWSHRVVWNNGVLDVAQTDGSLVYLYIHISQAWALASKAQGWETKNSHQSHTCVLVHAHAYAHTRTHQPWSNTTGPLCSSYSQPGLALPGPP